MALLVACLSVACHRQTQEPTLVVLTPGGALGKATREVVEAFQADHPGVHVQLITSPGKDYYVKSLTMLAGRAHVDLLWLGQGFGLFAGRNALRDLQPLLDRDPDFSLGGYHPEVLEWYRYGKRLYGIPYGVDLQVIAYNRQLLEAAGVPPPRSDWKLSDMIGIARKVTQYDPRTGRPLVMGLGLESLDFRYYGLSLLSEDRRRFGLNREVGREWLHHHLSLIYDDRILQQRGSLESMDRLTGFLNQQVALFDLATWDLPEASKRALFEWGAVPIPLGRTGKRAAWASSSGFCMVARTRQPDLAWKLLKRLTGAEFQRRMLDRSIPTLVSLHEEFRAAHAPRNVDAFLETLNGMDPTPRIIPLQEVEAEWHHWMDRALLREITPEEALEQAESHINRILALYPLPDEEEEMP